VYSNIKIISKNPKKFSVQISKKLVGSKLYVTKHVPLGSALAYKNYIALVEQNNNTTENEKC